MTGYSVNEVTESEPNAGKVQGFSATFAATLTAVSASQDNINGAVRAMPIRVQTCGDVCQDGTYVGASFDVRNRPQHARTDTAASCYAQLLHTMSVTDGMI